MLLTKVSSMTSCHEVVLLVCAIAPTYGTFTHRFLGTDTSSVVCKMSCGPVAEVRARGHKC